jgi:hypothetical protein
MLLNAMRALRCRFSLLDVVGTEQLAAEYVLRQTLAYLQSTFDTRWACCSCAPAPPRPDNARQPPGAP